MGADNRLVRTALSIFFTATVLFAAEPSLPAPQAIAKVDAWTKMEEHWRAIEPSLFTGDTPKKHIGDLVRFSGSPTSLRTPIVIKLRSGTIARLAYVQKADRDELANFRKPPSTVIVEGPITAIDVKTHTVTIKAVSTTFHQ